MNETERIDYSKYQVDELAETISDAILFPLYIGKVFGLVLLVFLVMLTMVAYMHFQNTFFGILFWFLAFIISLPTVIIFSVIRLFSTIQSDIEKVYEITLQTTKNIYKDTGLLRTQRQNDVTLKTTFSDVFKGVALFVIKPALNKVIGKRVKFFAFPFVFIIDTIFKKYVLKKVKTLPKQAIFESSSNEELVANYKYNFSDKTFKIIKFPFRFILIIYGFFNLALVYLFYLLLS
ncbi:hypothetical protein BWZ20_08995 [Winogradskyella sp. J14-2]|uniref:hypothetical protein n=1 Tax=Winogradskyella sp. J14-2 TaxID=1936080 RepID=UPI0009729F04|nr:hypothetical protein [Winogradskyella sp. J14-2]APY08424.1 hypothetical protein BWZ20_08995 [Winogradskyella sp. J14-2]